MLVAQLLSLPSAIPKQFRIEINTLIFSSTFIHASTSWTQLGSRYRNAKWIYKCTTFLVPCLNLRKGGSTHNQKKRERKKKKKIKLWQIYKIGCETNLHFFGQRLERKPSLQPLKWWITYNLQRLKTMPNERTLWPGEPPHNFKCSSGN